MKQLMTGIFVAALLPSLGFAEAMEQWKIDGKVERYTVHESPAQYGQGEGVFMFYLGDHKVLKGLSGCKDPSQPTVGFAIPLNTAVSANVKLTH